MQTETASLESIKSFQKKFPQEHSGEGDEDREEGGCKVGACEMEGEGGGVGWGRVS